MLLPDYAVGGDAAGLVHLVDKAFANGGGNQARDHVHTHHGNEQREDDVRYDQFSAQICEAAQPVRRMAVGHL